MKHEMITVIPPRLPLVVASSALLVALSISVTACGSSEDEPPPSASVGAGGGGGVSGGSGGAGAGGGATAGGHAGQANEAGQAGAGGSVAGAGAGGKACAAEADALLKPIDATSTGDVVTVSSDATSKTLFVDASAGGAAEAASHPRVYLSLSTGARVEVTDLTSSSSTAWDLALKRPILFTNGGQGGPGQGASRFVAGKAFDAVTSADAGTLASEEFLSVDCVPNLDATGAVRTSFDGWYDYDQATNSVTPKPGVWVVKGGNGATYKVQVLGYYANPDGSVGAAGGRYLLRVGAL